MQHVVVHVLRDHNENVEQRRGRAGAHERNQVGDRVRPRPHLQRKIRHRARKLRRGVSLLVAVVFFK